MTKYDNTQYRSYVLVMLTLVYAVNFIDRQLLTILQESIKADLHLSDLQLGLLTGLAFAVFYVLAGVPIARIADRSNRRNVIAWSIGIWSFMTAISGLVTNYIQLVLARIGVGIGEAGCSPPAHSMISDMYPPESRASALAFYSTGISIGVMLGYLLGGFINEHFGWRFAFFIVGLPGIAIALIVRFTIAEPIRGWSENMSGAVKDAPESLAKVIKFILERRFLVHIALGGGLAALGSYSVANWSPSYFIRSYGIPTGELGIWLASAAGIFGGVGTFFWGVICDRFGKKDKRFYFWLPALAVGLAVIPITITYCATTLEAALLANLFVPFFTNGYLGAALAVFHSSVEPRMRATASALLFLVLNIVGLGCGPTLVGAISDWLNPTLGNESVRYAILYVVPAAFIWSALHFFLAGRAAR